HRILVQENAGQDPARRPARCAACLLPPPARIAAPQPRAHHTPPRSVFWPLRAKWRVLNRRGRGRFQKPFFGEEKRPISRSCALSSNPEENFAQAIFPPASHVRV